MFCIVKVIFYVYSGWAKFPSTKDSGTSFHDPYETSMFSVLLLSYVLALSISCYFFELYNVKNPPRGHIPSVLLSTKACVVQ